MTTTDRAWISAPMMIEDLRRHFDATYRRNCNCEPLELEEIRAGQYRCAHCLGPISKRGEPR